MVIIGFDRRDGLLGSKQIDHSRHRIACAGHQDRSDAAGALVAFGVKMPRHGAGGVKARRLERRILDQIERQHLIHRAFNRIATHLAIALGGMGIADDSGAKFCGDCESLVSWMVPF